VVKDVRLVFGYWDFLTIAVKGLTVQLQL